MTTSSSSTKVPILPPLIVMSMKPKNTLSTNNIDENYDNGFIDLTKQNANSNNNNNLELETLRKKALKTTNTNSNNNKIINQIQRNNKHSFSNDETQLLNKLKSLNICSQKMKQIVIPHRRQLPINTKIL